MAGWAWAAASRCGTAHRDADGHRQDAVRVVAADGGVLIAVACDGAGSTFHGRYGAVISARTISQRAKAWVTAHALLPTPLLIDLWVAEARLSIIVAADRLGVAAGDFANTLVLAISDGEEVLTAHIGDGAVVAGLTVPNSLVVLSWPQGGEFAAETFFVTDTDPQLRIGSLRGWTIDRLAVMTDGLERLALDFSAAVAHPPFFDRLFGGMIAATAPGPCKPLSDALGRFLDADAVNARTTDDKTLVLAVMR
ncbi:protein phosphatase 2C domain-containing protein [Sphingomonas sp. AAP5]|uniref:PP2C family serine/threonine-protein phosphatase n=1 Tax=Sphingomonas sp. AAP5 TaxID=1523415 RepID=UPI0010573074|nr:PP2C family serine/threonine-protein phosphatase [Sphingomonas sp. AAP5]QBM75169.1 protein phosphatase 2C domain-containing protein [Sphingomonas sp. AAP5]